jgi:hypothetical protein
MSEATNINPYHWAELDFSETLIINGAPHLTRKAIGEWLEYANPQVAIANIIDRNTHILEFQYYSVVSNADGKNYEVFVYDPVGFMLIAMESQQPKAIEFKVAIAKFVAHFTKKPKISAEFTYKLQCRITFLTRQLALTQDACLHDRLKAEISLRCKQLNQPLPDFAKLGKDYRQDMLPFDDSDDDGRDGAD